MPLSVAAACSSKLKSHAESFSQRQAPRAVDARSERSVQNQLHTAGLVEKAFGDHAATGRASRPDPLYPHERRQRFVLRPAGRPRIASSAVRWLGHRRAHRYRRVTLRPRATARSFDPILRRSKTESWAAIRARLQLAPHRSRRAVSSTNWFRVRRYRRPCFRLRNLRRASPRFALRARRSRCSSHCRGSRPRR